MREGENLDANLDDAIKLAKAYATAIPFVRVAEEVAEEEFEVAASELMYVADGAGSDAECDEPEGVEEEEEEEEEEGDDFYDQHDFM